MSVASNKAVAVIQEHEAQRNTFSRWLEESGFRVWAFESVAVALEAMEGFNPPDIIITDLFMSEIDGWRFCRLLKSPEFRFLNHVPIMVTSLAYSGDNSAHLLEDLGAALFLPLPVEQERFIESVLSLTDPKKPAGLPKVLIVEDSSVVTELLKKTFSSYGYNASYVSTGKEAFEHAYQNDYDIIILDYHLPDTTGEKLLELTRKRLPDATYIMMTADSDPALSVRWMKAGAAAYLKKPFDPEYLIELCVKTRRECSLIRAEALLEEKNRKLQAGEEKYRVLFHELQHRVKNSLAMITSLINLEMGRHESPELKNILGEVSNRVQSFSNLYSLLKLSDGEDEIRLDEYIHSIATPLSSGYALSIDAKPLAIDAGRAASVGLIANEAITNAVKHGLAGKPDGKVCIRLYRTGGEAHLVIENNGRALPENFDPGQSAGMGLELISILADQLEGRVSYTQGDMTVFTLVIPA